MSSTGGPILTGSGSFIEGMTGSSGQLTEQALFYKVNHLVINFVRACFCHFAEKLNDKTLDLFGLSELEK
tara:strand:+ start:2424 stop:2633 length:210 start_codon:yes stop_codon:yes gene_type:complete